MSVLNVPLSRFPQVLSSPTCPTSRTSATSTSFVGSRQNPCASAHWSGMSGYFANPTPNTGYEPNFYRSYMNEEHTPINLPGNQRSFQCRDDATIISAAEDPEVPFSGASSSSKQTAASRVPTMLGSLSGKQEHESVASRASIQAGANLDRESVVPTIFSSQSKMEERSRSKRRAFVEREREKTSQKILERKVDSAVRGGRAL